MASPLKNLFLVAISEDKDLSKNWEAWLKKNSLDILTEKSEVDLLKLVYTRGLSLGCSLLEEKRLKGIYKKSWFEAKELLVNAESKLELLRQQGIEFVLAGDFALALHSVGINKFPFNKAEVIVNQTDLGKLKEFFRENSFEFCNVYYHFRYCPESLIIQDLQKRKFVLHAMNREDFQTLPSVSGNLLKDRSYRFITKLFALQQSMLLENNLLNHDHLRSAYFYKHLQRAQIRNGAFKFISLLIYHTPTCIKYHLVRLYYRLLLMGKP